MTDRGTLVRVPGPSEQHEPELTAEPAARSRTRVAVRLRQLLLQNWLLVAFLILGAALRVITSIAYQPAILYIDSFAYLNNLSTLPLNNLHPVGYELILLPLIAIGKPFGISLALTAAVQHLVGLGLAVVLYRIARGLGAHKIVAALITLPILLDAYQLQIEASIMSEIWSQAVLLCALWLLVAWKFRVRGGQGPAGAADAVDALGAANPAPRFGPGPWQAAAAGALVAASVPIRTVAMVVVLAWAAYLVLAGARWRDRQWRRAMVIRSVAGLAGFAVILGGYMVAFRAQSGHWGLSGASSGVLYGRGATVANCKTLKVDRYVAQLCPKAPVGQRHDVDYYNNLSSTRVHPLPPGKSESDMRREFGMAVLKQQPFDVVKAILKDFAKGFAWTKKTTGNDVPISRWQFQIDYQRWYATDADTTSEYFDHTRPHVVHPLTRFLRAYQLNGGYTPGTLLAVAGLVGVAGMFSRRGGLRAESMVAVGFGVLLVLGGDAYLFSWRYQLPGLVFFPLAGAIGFTALTTRRTSARHSADTMTIGTTE